MKRLFAVVFFGQVFLAAFGQLSEFQGPRRDTLYAYWPFDSFSGVEDIANDGSSLGTTTIKTGVGHLVYFDPPGPFGANSTSYSTNNASIYIVRYPDAELPTNFTISFYFYTAFKKDNSNYKRILKFGQGVGQEFAIGYMGNHLFLDLPYVKANDANSTPYWSAFSPSRWSFVSITYENPSRILRVFDASGVVLLTTVLQQPMPTWLMGLAIGAIEKKDRLACLQIYKEPLVAEEIARLPCVCKTRGRCPDGLTYRQAPYQGPRPESLLGFWPLTEDFGLDEMTSGKGPVRLPPARRVKTSTLNGPFRYPLQLHTPTENGDWIIDSYKTRLGEEGSFSIAFYFHYQNFVEKVDTAIPLVKFGRLTLAFSDKENVIMLVRDNFNTIVNVANLLSSGDWKFIAMTYNKAEKMLQFYNENGDLVAPFDNIQLRPLREPLQAGDIEISVGPTRRRMSMACLSVYNISLTASEIAELRCACLNTVEQPKPKSCPKLETDVGVTALNYLTAYWPFDAQSGVNDIANAVDDLGAQISGKLDADEAGPFKRAATSYSVSKKGGDRLSTYRLNFAVPKGFTFSVYFYKGDLKSSGSVFGMKQTPSTCKEPLFEIRYASKFLTIEAPDTGSTANVSLLDLPIGGWEFIAVTYCATRKVLSVHRPSGDLYAEFNNFALSDQVAFGDGTENGLKNDATEMWFGPLQPGDRVSCAMFWRKVLTETEIARIPCACRTRGRCPDYLRYDTKAAVEFQGHEADNLVGWWPLNRKSGLAEVAKGLLPSFVSREVRLDSRENGPFDTVETSYSLGLGMTSAVSFMEYNLGSKLDPNTWTISFYLYIDDKTPGGEVIRIYQGDEANFLISIQYSSRKMSIATCNSKRREFPVKATKNGFVFATFSVEKDTERPDSLIASFYTNEQGSFWSPIIGKDIRLPHTAAHARSNMTLQVARRFHAVDCFACLSIWNGVALHQTAISQLPELCEHGRISHVAATPAVKRSRQYVIFADEATTKTSLHIEIVTLVASTPSTTRQIPPTTTTSTTTSTSTKPTTAAKKFGAFSSNGTQSANFSCLLFLLLASFHVAFKY